MSCFDDRGALTGEVGFVPDLPAADVVVVAALTDDGSAVAVRVDLDGPGVEIDPVVRFDHTRPLAHLRLNAARAERLAVTEDDLARTWHLAQALLAAEALGATQTVLDMGVADRREGSRLSCQIAMTEELDGLTVVVPADQY